MGEREGGGKGGFSAIKVFAHFKQKHVDGER